MSHSPDPEWLFFYSFSILFSISFQYSFLIPKKILSDDKIVAIMQGEGVDIARRTVAKYREAMRIPSSVQRRRQKRMA